MCCIVMTHWHLENLPSEQIRLLMQAAKKYGIEDKMPILIAEKMGPHFAVGDTCYSWCEDISGLQSEWERNHSKR